MASYPGSIVSLTNPQGTNLLTSPDHGALHTSENNEIVALESLLGTTAAANGLLNSYTSGQTPLPIQSGTIGSIISKGTINTSVFGTNQYTGGTLGTANLIGGTISGQIQNNGTITSGVYGGTPTLITPIAKTEFNAGTISGNGTITWTNGDRQNVTFSGTGTLAFTGAVLGQVLSLWLIENPTGGYTITLPTIRWPNGNAPTFGTAASAVNSVVIRYDGTSYFGNSSTSYS